MQDSDSARQHNIPEQTDFHIGTKYLSGKIVDQSISIAT
jgi:hypothetical protein